MKLQVEEGSVKLFTEDGQEAFYNETQVFNRDFSMLGAHTFLTYRCPKKAFTDNKINILDAMTATGLRALRYSREMGYYKCIQILKKQKERGQVLTDIDKTIPINIFGIDLSESAVQRACNNQSAQDELVDTTGAPRAAHEVTFLHNDCVLVMFNRPQDFTIIDLDPFGHPSVFFDAAIRAIVPGGLIAATATDGLVTCGRQPDECVVRYQSRPAKACFSHEFSVRMVIGNLALACIRNRVSLKVLYSFFHCHYLRVFCTCKGKDGIPPAELANHLWTVQYCRNCGWNKELQCLNSDKAAIPSASCPLCQGGVFRAGPVWLGDIADASFCDQLLEELQVKAGKTHFDDGEFNSLYDTRKYLRLAHAKQMYAHVVFTREEIGRRALFVDPQLLSSIYHTQALPNSVLFNYCEKLGRYCVSSSYLQTGFKLQLADEELRDLFYFWWALQSAAGAASRPWAGPMAGTIQFHGNTIMDLLKKFQKDQNKCQHALEIMRERGFVDDNIQEEDLSQIPKYHKEIRGLGLFQPNPDKGFGPKKMV